MASPRSGSTSTIQQVLKGKNLEIAGTREVGNGSTNLLAGFVTLGSLGLHVLTFHPHVTALSVFAHLAVGAVGACWTVSGINKIAEGNEAIADGQRIANNALSTPNFAETNIVMFTARTLGDEPTPPAEANEQSSNLTPGKCA